MREARNHGGYQGRRPRPGFEAWSGAGSSSSWTWQDQGQDDGGGWRWDPRDEYLGVRDSVREQLGALSQGSDVSSVCEPSLD